MNTEDVLKRWDREIADAGRTVGQWGPDMGPHSDTRCIQALAAEVRALRESEKSPEAQLWDSEMARLASAKEIGVLQARVAELETPKTQIQELQVWGEENEIVNGEIIRRKRVLQYYVDKADGLQARLAELEAELRPFMTWTCANCGRINPGTMPYCPCREESDE